MGADSRTDRRLHVRVLDGDSLRLVTCWTAAAEPGGRAPEHDPDAWRRSAHPHDMQTRGHPDFGVCAAADAHYLSTGGTRAAAMLAADAVFTHGLAERTAVVPAVPPYRPGEFYRRELPRCARSWQI